MSEKINLMIEGGKATPSPQMAQSLGPKKIPIQKVISEINEKTSNFKGLKLPVNIEIDEKNNYIITIGTPPVSELLKNEAAITKGSGEPNKNILENLAIEQIIKIARMKKDSMLVNNLKSAVKCVAGSCSSAGILIEGKRAAGISRDIDAGIYDSEIKQEKTNVSPEKKEILKQQLKVIQEEIKRKIEKEKVEVKEKPKEEGKEAVEEVKEAVEEVKEEKKKGTKP